MGAVNSVRSARSRPQVSPDVWQAGEVSSDSPNDAVPPLPGGVTFEQLRQAVDKSGYPLQTVVAKKIGADFLLQPEWGFLDRTTEEMRAIDLLATRELYDLKKSNVKRVRPRLVLVIECKKSELPYVFFRSDYRIEGNFPHVAGLHSSDITFTTDDDPSRWIEPIRNALGLERHPFIVGPEGCMTLSKCTRKGGSDIVLSGTVAYQGMVMPIRSAVEHFRVSAQPRPTFRYFEANLVVGLAILDAPMISATVGDRGESILERINWQRLWRHEPIPGDPGNLGHRYGESSAIDIVHIDFLSEYLQDHLMPFAKEFAEKALRHDMELATGKGFASGMEADSWTDLEARLRPRPALDLPKGRGRALTKALKRIGRTGAARSPWKQRPGS
jgi:hypothetical protein